MNECIRVYSENKFIYKLSTVEMLDKNKLQM